jgi:hypothetical protein
MDLLDVLEPQPLRGEPRAERIRFSSVAGTESLPWPASVSNS